MAIPRSVALAGAARRDRYGVLPDPNEPLKIGFAGSPSQAEFDRTNRDLQKRAMAKTTAQVNADREAQARAAAVPGGPPVYATPYVDPADDSALAAFPAFGPGTQVNAPAGPTKPPAGPVVTEAAHRAAAVYRDSGPRPVGPGPAATAAPTTSHLRVDVGQGMTDYVPGDPRMRLQNDLFAESRVGAPREGSFAAEGGGLPVNPGELSVGPESPTGGHSETMRQPTEQEATLDWLRFKRGSDLAHAAEDEALAGAEAGAAGSRAAAARSRLLEAEPFAPEEITARGKLGAEAVKAETETSRRNMILKIVNGMSANINRLHSDPTFAKLPAAERQKAEDRVIEEATLALGALGRINLSPKASNPLDVLASGLGGEPKKE